jgi:hypothetical protein
MSRDQAEMLDQISAQALNHDQIGIGCRSSIAYGEPSGVDDSVPKRENQSKKIINKFGADALY